MRLLVIGYFLLSSWACACFPQIIDALRIFQDGKAGSGSVWFVDTGWLISVLFNGCAVLYASLMVCSVFDAFGIHLLHNNIVRPSSAMRKLIFRSSLLVSTIVLITTAVYTSVLLFASPDGSACDQSAEPDSHTVENMEPSMEY